MRAVREGANCVVDAVPGAGKTRLLARLAVDAKAPLVLAYNRELAAAMATSRVAPFAEFTTRRAKFELDGASVDVDAASFGHAVCEVEVLCAYASQVPDAEAKIAYVAQRLGLAPLTDSGGKLETFIRRNCPTHLKVLVEAGYLKPEPARAPASKCAGG